LSLGSTLQEKPPTLLFHKPLYTSFYATSPLQQKPGSSFLNTASGKTSGTVPEKASPQEKMRGLFVLKTIMDYVFFYYRKAIEQYHLQAVINR